DRPAEEPLRAERPLERRGKPSVPDLCRLPRGGLRAREVHAGREVALMAEGAQNHYQVLQIERTADERAVKKAYFKLIRQYPPDTRAEELKRLRAAYEVLSDPVARQRFDSAEKDFGEYGEEVGATLKAIEQIQKSGDEPEAQRRLKALIRERPELAIARES